MAQPQQVVIQQPVIHVMPSNTHRPGFAHHSQNRLGILQILCGMLLAIVSVAMIFFQSSLYFFGYGIWTGVFFITAGALAVQSAKSKNTCPIVGCLIMCIFCLMAGAVVVAFGVIGLAVENQKCTQYSWTADDRYESDCSSEGELFRNLNIALQAINLITGVFVWIVALIQMIICSRALCCAPSQPGAVYYATSPQQVQVAAQYPQQQPAYPQYQQYHGQPYYPQPYPQAQYPDQRGMAYPAAQPYQPAPQQSVYPNLPMGDPGRPPPYNPAAEPSASAPSYTEAGALPTKG